MTDDVVMNSVPMSRLSFFSIRRCCRLMTDDVVMNSVPMSRLSFFFVIVVVVVFVLTSLGLLSQSIGVSFFCSVAKGGIVAGIVALVVVVFVDVPARDFSSTPFSTPTPLLAPVFWAGFGREEELGCGRLTRL